MICLDSGRPKLLAEFTLPNFFSSTFCFSSLFSYFAAGKAFFNPFKFLGHKIVLIRLHFLLC